MIKGGTLVEINGIRPHVEVVDERTCIMHSLSKWLPWLDEAGLEDIASDIEMDLFTFGHPMMWQTSVEMTIKHD